MLARRWLVENPSHESLMLHHAFLSLQIYWAKKIIEWTEDPEEAFQVVCHLNDKYQLDGRDPNSYAAIAWCFGRHDGSFPDRGAFGKVGVLVYTRNKHEPRTTAPIHAAPSIMSSFPFLPFLSPL